MVGPGEEEAVPVLRVTNAARSVAWYQRLGFRQQWAHQYEPGFPWFVCIARGRVRLFLSEHRGAGAPTALIHLYVADVDAVAAEFGDTVDEQGVAGRRST